MEASQSDRFQLTPDLNICRLPVGMWQVSGEHGRIDAAAAIDSMFVHLDAGFTTFDMADHYGPAEDLMGEFSRKLVQTRGRSALNDVQAFTKWVPQPQPMTRQTVEQAIDLSRRRMNCESLEMLQFHWWDYADDRFLDALRHLADLQAEGKIRHLALTNVDTKHLKIIRDASIEIVSNQVQYSLVDLRPQMLMTSFCEEHGIKLLTYGTLCGGLMSERYLGRPEPPAGELNTASLRKYKKMIDRWGGWTLFQELLHVLDGIAKKHSVSIPNIAVRAILDRKAVAAVIIGCRLGVTQHIEENKRVLRTALDEQDRVSIERVLAKSSNLLEQIGDCGDEYRG